MAEHSNNLVTVKSNSSLQIETGAQNDTTNEEQNEKVFYPLLVYESTSEEIPLNLQNIIKNLSNYGGSEKCKTDLLICILYVLMIETGFVPKQRKDNFGGDEIDFHKGRVLALSYLPERWKTEDGLYKFEFILVPFPEYICKMYCIVVNQNLTVNLILKPTSKYCIYLETSRYVHQEDNKILSKKFNNLNELSICFKNQIALPAKNAILTAESVPSSALQDLPTEIYYYVFNCQDVFDFIRLKSTCKRLQQCAKYFNHELWEIYFKRDFPRAATSARTNPERWDLRYQFEYSNKLKVQKREDANSFWRRRRPFLSFDVI